MFVLGYILNEAPLDPRIGVSIQGAFADDNINITQYFLYVNVQLLHLNYEMDYNSSILQQTKKSYTENDVETFRIPIVDRLEDIDSASELKKSHVFQLHQEMFNQIGNNQTILRLRIRTNLPVSFPIELTYDATPIDKSVGVIYAAIVLLGLYIMIVWEIVHRTFAAMFASTMSIGLLAMMNERPTMPELMSWIDVETLLLLFGMMILVAILSETGIFDCLAVYAYKVHFLFVCNRI